MGKRALRVGKRCVPGPPSVSGLKISPRWGHSSAAAHARVGVCVKEAKWFELQQKRPRFETGSDSVTSSIETERHKGGGWGSCGSSVSSQRHRKLQLKGVLVSICCISSSSRKANVCPAGCVIPRASQHSPLRTRLAVALGSQAIVGACWAGPGGNSAWGAKVS